MDCSAGIAHFAAEGIGRLGHLGVQFARRMGFCTEVITRGKEKEKLPRELDAEHYIDSTVEDPAQALQELGGANAILATAASGKSMGPLLAGLKARGKLIVVRASHEPIEVVIPQLMLYAGVSKRSPDAPTDREEA